MTRYNGWRAYACPECAAPYSEGILSSFTLWDRRRWSDGYAPPPAAVAPERVRRCASCGALHFQGEGELLYEPDAGRTIGLEVAVSELLDRLRAPRRPWWRRTWRALRGDGPPPAVQPTPREAAPAPERPPHRVLVGDDELAQTLADGVRRRDVEIELRRQYWRALNAPFRRNDLPSLDAADWPQAGAAQAANLTRLAELLGGESEPAFLEIGEAYRQLGRFLDARAMFAQAPPSDVIALLDGLAAEGDGRVVRIDSLAGH